MGAGTVQLMPARRFTVAKPRMPRSGDPLLPKGALHRKFKLLFRLYHFVLAAPHGLPPLLIVRMEIYASLVLSTKARKEMSAEESR